MQGLFKPILIALVVFACQSSELTKERTPSGRISNLDRAITFAVHLEAHASRLEDRKDICVGFGHGIAVNEKEVILALKRRKLNVHSNDWCNQGPRGLVISIVAPTTEPIPGTYELEVEVGDLRPIRAGGHFATLVRRGTYTVKCKDALEPDLVSYQEAGPAGDAKPEDSR